MAEAPRLPCPLTWSEGEETTTDKERGFEFFLDDEVSRSLEELALTHDDDFCALYCAGMGGIGGGNSMVEICSVDLDFMNVSAPSRGVLELDTGVFSLSLKNLLRNPLRLVLIVL